MLVVFAEFRGLEVDDVTEVVEVVIGVVVEPMLEVEFRDGAEEDVAGNGETVTMVGTGWITRHAISTVTLPLKHPPD